MSIETSEITVSGVRVSIVRKAIKNLHLAVYPPHGRVRVAAPLAVSDEAVRLAVIGKLGWIKWQQARFESQPRQSERRGVLSKLARHAGKTGAVRQPRQKRDAGAGIGSGHSRRQARRLAEQSAQDQEGETRDQGGA